jgi:hypothetical protein
MAKPGQPIPPQAFVAPLTRAKSLARKMAKVLKDEEISDAAIAIALLTGGIVNHYAHDATHKSELIKAIREVEDKILTKSSETENLRLH